ncbi:hypothetical protein HK097_009393, partial [Rhizophlyctis rosea]
MPEAFKSRDKIPRNSMEVSSFVPPRAAALSTYISSPLARSMKRSDTPDSENSSPRSPAFEEARRVHKSASKKSLKVNTGATREPTPEVAEVKQPLYYGRWTNYDDVPIPTVMKKVLDDETQSPPEPDEDKKGRAERGRSREKGSPEYGGSAAAQRLQEKLEQLDAGRGRDRTTREEPRGRQNGNTQRTEEFVTPPRSRSRPRQERS